MLTAAGSVMMELKERVRHVSLCRLNRGRGFSIGLGLGLSCFEPLHLRQQAARLSHASVPPRVSGTMWSTVVASAPQ
jgi:hypothetical protein